MKNAPVPKNEKERINELHKFQILDTLPEAAFDEITKLTSLICGGQICLISFVDSKRQWFKSKYGTSVEQTPRENSFCAHTIMQENVFEVQDTSLDDRFKNNPLVIGPPSIRWYAGAPLMTSKGFIIGTLCVFGNTPRALNADQRVALIALAKQVITLLEFKEREIQFKKQSKELENLFDLSLDLICIADSEGFFKYLNPAWSLVLGYSEEELKAHPLSYFIHKDDVPQTLEEINKLKHGELTINFTHRFCTKEGSFRELNWFAYPEEKSGQFYAIARDITK